MIDIGEARGRDMVVPVYLVEIALKGSSPPTLYFSDRNITVGGQLYEDYLDSLSAIGSELKRADSTRLNSSVEIVFKNEPYSSHPYLIQVGDANPFVGAECTIKEGYLDTDGIPSVTETIFKGRLDEPRNIDLDRFTCAVSTITHAADNNW